MLVSSTLLPEAVEGSITSRLSSDVNDVTGVAGREGKKLGVQTRLAAAE